MEKGLFIVLEGIDGSGKSTQARLLKKSFEDYGLPVLQTREPGGTELGEEIREILLKDRYQDKMMDPLTQTLLFHAARQEFLTEVVRPALQSGVTVIADRFEPSSFVYQGYVQGVAREVEVLSQLIVGSEFQPNLCVVLDIPPEVSYLRKLNPDRIGQDLIFEHQGLEFARKLREGYLEYAKQHPSVVLLDGTQSPDKVHQQIVIGLRSLLLLRGLINA
ncbi:MAG: dTMP kinase [Candidatus Daviesbacteria bacterium]|nr:MAG: dTMP kinase [Candidatus Daviesbacteria bacterium]